MSAILEEEVGAFTASLHTRATQDGANPFKVGLFTDEEIAAHRQGRSVDSKLGNTLEHLCARLAAERYPDACPTTILGDGVRPEMLDGVRTPQGSRYRPGAPKPVVWSRLDARLVQAAAGELTDHIHRTGERIGSEAFAARLAAARADIREAPLQDDPWPAITDFWCAHPDLGFAEVKAGGNLDNTKARAEVQELLRTALVAPDAAIQPRVHVCYPSRGDDDVAGALPSYLERSHLLIGREMWSRVLPEPVTYEAFLACYEETGRRLRARDA